MPQKGTKRPSDQEVRDKPVKKLRGRPRKEPVVVIENGHQSTIASPTGEQRRRSTRGHQATPTASVSRESAGRQKTSSVVPASNGKLPSRSRIHGKKTGARTAMPAEPEAVQDSDHAARTPPLDQTGKQTGNETAQTTGDAVGEEDPDWEEPDRTDAEAQDSDDQETQARAGGLPNDWYTKLEYVFTTAKAIRSTILTNEKAELKTESAKALVKACKQFRIQVVSSESSFLLLHNDRDLEDHPDEQLSMVNSWRKILDLTTKIESETGFETTLDLYAHVIPRITLVLRDVLTKFGRRSMLREEHYGALLAVVKVIVSLGHHGTILRNQNLQASRKEPGLDDSDLRKQNRKNYLELTELAIVNPVKNNIIAELKKIQQMIRKVLYRQVSATQAAAEQQATNAARCRAQDRERRAAEREAILKPWRDVWTGLHNAQDSARLLAHEYGGFKASWQVPGKADPVTKWYTTADQVADMIPELNRREGLNEQAWRVAGNVLMAACFTYLGPEFPEADLWVNIVYEKCKSTPEAIKKVVLDERGRRVLIPPPLLEFSVTEIVSRAIFARDQLLESDHLDEENRAWISRIWDPRLRPTLPGDEVVDNAMSEVVGIEDEEDEGDGEDGEEDEGVEEVEDDDQAEDDGQEAAEDDRKAEHGQDEDEDQAEDVMVED